MLRYNEITAAMGNKFNDFFCLSKSNIGRLCACSVFSRINFFNFIPCVRKRNVSDK